MKIFSSTGVAVYYPTGDIVPIPGIADAGLPNTTLRPIVDTLSPVPWLTYGSLKTAEVLCEASWFDDRPQNACPRYVARKQLNVLKQLGYEIVSGFECECIISSKDPDKKLFQTNASDFMSLLAFSENYPFFYSLESQLRQSGIDLEAMHMETSPGQVEFVTFRESGLRAADNIFRLKTAAKEIASQHGYALTFMAKPFNQGVNGLHFTHSLRSIDDQTKSTNEESSFVFYDGQSSNHLSEVCHWWLAGLIKHGPALTALCSPTVNCYRRLHKPRIPTKFDWGFDDRSVTFRVKANSPSGTCIENRLGSGAANPYLLLAATVAAGIDGIKNRLPCPPPKESVAADVPHTLADSLKCLLNDTVIVDALGKEFIEWFRLLKEVDLSKLKDSNVKDPNDLVGSQKERDVYLRNI